MQRCEWASNVEPLYTKYHDEEWGRPLFDDRKLFEMLILEGAQAGLSWITILKKRQHYRQAFDDFDAEKIACYSDSKRIALLQDAGIIRNRLKINAAIVNAQCYLKILDEFQGFSDYLWQFVNGKPIRNSWKSMQDIPVSTPESEAMSKALKKRGFKFVGPRICYAFMQAVGMVNDHTSDCFCYRSAS
ncbi:MAG: DNA-3-methyladenine glycosylase I [gamma proteobacterium symbiont of Bathyaustriella thionipta]|nr:DNA-3-methyladenine glycosylase I [gamma proteobacterium symbiont of Bathyaustriella thionipta]